MHSDVVAGLIDRLNNIAQFTSGFHKQSADLIPEIVGALNILGFRNFAAMTVNNFNIVQRTTASFAASEKFFGRDLTAIVAPELLIESAKTGEPMLNPCGLLLAAPFDTVYMREEDQRYFALHTVYRDQFTRGYMVIFGPNTDVLRTAQWRLQTLAERSVEATIKLPTKVESPVTLREIEIEVMRWTYEHKTAGEVAGICGLTTRNATFYIGEACKKLGASNKGQAAKMAKEMGLF
jgi:DNA-binding CsgD family transcriptional regulator